MGSSLGTLVAEYRTKGKGPVLRLKRCIQFRPGRFIIDVRNCYFIHSLIVKTYYEISTNKICDSIILFSKHDAGNCGERGHKAHPISVRSREAICSKLGKK